MDKFIEEVLKKYKWENLLLLVVFLTIPAVVFVFVWNREVFLGMDIIKLLVFSFSIGFMIFMPNIIFVTICLELESRFRAERLAVEDLLPFAITMTVLIIVLGIVCKLFNHTFTILDFIISYVVILCMAGIIKVIVEYMYYRKSNK